MPDYRLTSPSRKANGRSLDELPFKAAFGVWGSYVCVLINVVALVAQFYVALYPVGGPNLNAEDFFISYLAGPLLIFLYLLWKAYSWFAYPDHRPLWIPIRQIDIYSGMREEQVPLSGANVPETDRRASVASLQQEQKKSAGGRVLGIVRNVF